MASSSESDAWFDCLQYLDDVQAGLRDCCYSDDGYRDDDDEEESRGSKGKCMPCIGRGLPLVRFCDVKVPSAAFYWNSVKPSSAARSNTGLGIGRGQVVAERAELSIQPGSIHSLDYRSSHIERLSMSPSPPPTMPRRRSSGVLSLDSIDHFPHLSKSQTTAAAVETQSHLPSTVLHSAEVTQSKPTFGAIADYLRGSAASGLD